MSACAIYILPATHEAKISKNALVAFHPGSLALVEFYTKKGLEDRLSLEIHQNAREARKLYARKNINPKLQMDTLMTLEPLCVDHLEHPTKLKTKYAFWIPSKSYLEAVNFQVSGYWPSSVYEVKKSLKHRIKDGTAWFFGHNKKMDFGIEIALLGIMNTCTNAKQKTAQ